MGLADAQSVVNVSDSEAVKGAVGSQGNAAH